MKAAVVRDFAEPLRVEKIPKPESGPGEVVVKVEASGLHLRGKAGPGKRARGRSRLAEVEKGKVDARLVFDFGAGKPADKTAGVLSAKPYWHGRITEVVYEFPR